MKVLLINGSPHKEGCTYTALSEAAKTLTQEGINTELFWIGNKPVGGCIACLKCGEIGKCVFDDVVNLFRPKAYEADGFVFGTPVHYAAASGNMTAFMDRLFYSELRGNGNKAFRMKPAAAVVSARRAGTTAAFDQMIKYFTIQEMPVVSTRYWNMVHGAKPEDVKKDGEGLFTMRELGRNMAYLLRCQEAGRSAGIEPPNQEAKVFTNFIRE
jgi:multimeric flavodoxin WrbA